MVFTAKTCWNEELNCYEDIPIFPYPTEVELLQIFPEAKSIIDQKIDDWLRIKGKVFCKEIEPILDKIAQIKDPFSKYFWSQAYRACYEPHRYTLAVKNLERLKRLKLMATAPKYASKVNNRERARVIAKDTPILSLYPFQKLRKVGGRSQALCPFHPDTNPSLTIFPDNHFKCWSCGASGDSIDFVRLLRDCSYNDAVGELVGVV